MSEKKVDIAIEEKAKGLMAEMELGTGVKVKSNIKSGNSKGAAQPPYGTVF